MDAIDIARMEEARQASAVADMVRVGMETDPACADHRAQPIAGGMMTYAGPGSWANQACGLGLAGPVSDTELDELVEFYASRGLEPRIEVCGLADQSLVDGLAERGFVLLEFENVLARELNACEDLEELLPRPVDSSVRVSRVDGSDAEAVFTLADVASSGFRPEGTPPTEPMLRSTRQLMTLPACAGFLAEVDGQVVGGGTMEASPPAASLFGASVLPAFRRRGIQLALIFARLALAQERGCRLATIHSKPGIATERNAASVGFSLAYAKGIMVMRGEGLAASP